MMTNATRICDQPEPWLGSRSGHHVATGVVILPPVIGRGMPVVGKLIGSPRGFAEPGTVPRSHSSQPSA